MIVLLSDGSKFYSKSLTLLVRILELINEEFILIKIAKVLNMEKSHVSYYIGKAKRAGFVKEVLRDRIKILELTQVGKNFLDQYQVQDQVQQPIFKHATAAMLSCRKYSLQSMCVQTSE